MLFYDLLDRNPVRPRAQSGWDVNDTVLLDPRNDPDVAHLVHTCLASLPNTNTWYTRRITGGLGPDEQDAATKTAVHAATPTRAYHDTLARPVVTTVHNRYARTTNGTSSVVEEHSPTRYGLDVEGNHRTIIDPLGRTVAVTIYGPAGRTLKTTSADAGDTITLADATTKPIRAFDSRGHTTRTTYDPLRRPLRTYVRLDKNPEALRERVVYGDADTAPGEAANLRTRPTCTSTAPAYHRPPRSTRQSRRNPPPIAKAYREQLDWAPSIDTATDHDLIEAER